jgi:hypothetical protein
MAMDITGRVIDRQTGNGVLGAKVEIWPLGVAADYPVAITETRQAGVFYSGVDESFLRKLRGTGLCIRVLHDGELIATTDQLLVVRPDVDMPEIIIEVDWQPVRPAAKPPIAQPVAGAPAIEPIPEPP